MKQNILAIVAEFVILAAVLSSNDLSAVAGNDLAAKSMNGISYVSGGFGIEERQRVRRIARKENLELSFALRNNEYVEGAEVVIKDAGGKTVLKTVSDGPLFSAGLPAGTYTIEATALGKRLTQHVQVPAKGQAHAYFAWNAANELLSQSVVQE